MRKISALLLLMLGTASAMWAQSYVVQYFPNAGNPGGVNTEGDAPGLNAWTNLITGPRSANQWSPVLAIPFPFSFYGQPVTHLRASQNCVISFDTTAAAVLPGDNANLPTAGLPNMSIAGFWDAFTSAAPTGTGDDVRWKVLGTAPNRQLWIKWYSFEYGSPFVSFAYNSIVLEETSNKIYVVDQYSSTTPALTATVGVQLDATTATQFGTGSVAQGGNGTATTDNDYYEFTLATVDPNVSLASILPFSQVALNGCASATEPVAITVTNLSATPATGVQAYFSVDGGAPQGPETIPGTLATGQTVSYTFGATANLAAPGAHTVTAWVSQPGDINLLNDTLDASLTTIASQTVPLPTLSFTGFSGGNLSTLYPGWREGEGLTVPTGTTSGWTSKTFANNAASPNGTAMSFNLYNLGDNDWFVAPKLTATSNTVVMYDLALTNYNLTTSGFLGSDDVVEIRVSADCGISYTTVFTYNSSSVISNTGERDTVSLAAYAGQEIIVGFFASEGLIDDAPDVDFFIDNLAFVNLSPLPNVAMSSITLSQSALNGCGSAAETVSIGFANLSITPASGVAAYFSVDGGTPVGPEAIPATIGAGQSSSYTFTGTANLSGAGLHTIEAWLVQAGDTEPLNDTLATNVTTVQALTLPYPTLDFTGYNGANLSALYPGWFEAQGVTAPSGTTGDWANKVFANNAASPNGTAINFNLYNTGDFDWFVGPRFVATAQSFVKYDLAMTTWNGTASGFLGSDDVVQLMVSTDCGVTYTPLLTYNNTSVISNTGQQESISLSAYAGQEIAIAFYASEGTIDDAPDMDVFIDNINLINVFANDAGAAGFVGITNEACGDSTTMGQIIVTGFGTAAQTNVPVQVIVTGPASADTFNLVAPALAAGQSDTLMFGPFNTYAGGVFTVSGATQLAGDQQTPNDTKSATYNFRTSLPPVTTSPVQACVGLPTLLAVTPEPLTLFDWYDAPTGGTLIGTGASISVTPTANTTYYVEAVPSTFKVGPTTNTFGTGAQYTFFGDGITFNVLDNIILESVKVYPVGAGVITINAVGTTNATQSFTFGGTVADTVLTLNFSLAPGSYELNATGSTVASMYRNNGSAVFPYSVPNVVSLTGTINGLGSSGFYYFFYDWSVKGQGCPRDRGAVDVIVNPLPVAAFTANTSELTTTLSSSAVADSVLYLYGDGTFGTDSVHTYATAGVYTVCQLAYSATCGVDTACTVVAAICNTPVAGFTSSGTEFTFSFNSTATNAESVSYDFGDGTTSTDPNPTHVYAAAGTYTVCQIAYRFCGNDTSCVTVDAICNTPVAGFTAATNELVVTLTSTATNAETTSYTYGDGTSGTDATHTYALPGTYEVCQIVTRFCGSDTFCQNVTVTCAPASAEFSFVVDSSTVVTFTSGATNADSIRFVYGTTAFSTSSPWTYDFGASGTYDVSMIAYSKCGNDTNIVRVSVIRTGINDLLDESSLVLFPNPTERDVTLGFTLRKAADLHVSIVDMRGRAVFSQDYDRVAGAFQTDISLPGLAKGVSLVQIRVDDALVIRKLRVE
ncbi:MAG: PKD domain-containing protein [Bacteroidia bacterium]|nr:PKD domain-containing protein [Bacteroidia bacterium]